jgi:thiol-disulfide isomerase/thioredoxin
MAKLSLRKNNKRLLFGLAVVVVVGLAVLYYLSIRNQEGFASEKMTNTEDALALIKDKQNFVLVFHKMEGCGHCVKFTPTWNEFAGQVDTLFPSKKVKCIMVDPSNDLSADVQGFPTVRYYKSPTDHVEFESERTVEALKEFVKENMN